jgi:hypothetical protein
MTYFASIEMRSLKLSGFYWYFVDPWNVLDVLSTCLNFAFTTMLMINIGFETNYLSKFMLRSIGGVASFCMWIKVFYWMRLFAFTAHYVTLITETVKDVRTFFVMIIIIMTAFANFFYIVNFNTPANPENDGHEFAGNLNADYSYVPVNQGNAVFDAILSSYLLALGEFSTDGFTEGPNVTICWVFFIMASFLILVVFMNMLITIVSETFSKVMEIKDELSLSEQLYLIQDHIFLIDLSTEFTDKKYIIRLYPDVTQAASDDNELQEEIMELSATLSSKNEQMFQKLIKVESFEKSNRGMMKA